MLDIGAGTTSISIFQEGAIIYSGCIPLGGVNITSDIAIGLQVSLEDAEKIKLNMEDLLSDKVKSRDNKMDKRPALLRKVEEEEEEKEIGDKLDLSVIGVTSEKSVTKDMLRKIVDARCEEIFDMAKESVEKAGYDIAMPAGIVITGGTALLSGITKLTQNIFGVPARIGYASGLSGMTEEISDPGYSCVQGLIKHALDDDVEINTENKKVDMGGFFGKIVEWFKSLLP
jgi:cell division protein FtsA